MEIALFHPKLDLSSEAQSAKEDASFPLFKTII